MNKDLLLTFRHDPVYPLAYHFHKQQDYRAKMTLTRSVSCPLPDSSSKMRGYANELIGNGSLPKDQGKLYCGNTTQNPVQFESSRKHYEKNMASVAKWRANGNFDMNEAVIVRDVNFSQNQKEIKHIKNLKQKIEHVTKESRKEKLRVAMDSVVHKLPQGHGISDELKKEILKKLTDPNVTKESEYCPKNHSNSMRKIWSHMNSIRRSWSLQEPLESYCQHQENSFKTEATLSQSEKLKLKTEKAHSPLRMLIPLQRILSLPDLQSYSYASQNGDISDISSLTKRLDLNVHSKCQLQLDTIVEDLTQENLVCADENDLMIGTIVGLGSDCISKINGKVDIIIDDFGHSSLKNSETFSDQVIGPIKEYKVAIAASDSKSKAGAVEKQEANMDPFKVIETTKNAQKVDIPYFDVDSTNKFKAEFNYVKYVLEISGLTTTNECVSAWHSRDTPLDPLLYEEMESDPEFCTYENGKCNHHVLFDLINETLLEIYGKSNCYYLPMKFMGCHILHQVWTHMNKSLCLRSKAGHQRIDDHVRRDLAKVDGWVNLQFHDHCVVGLEVEDLIFHDLLQEIMWDLAS